MSNFILNLRQVHLYTPAGPDTLRVRLPSTRIQTIVFASPTSYTSNVVGNLGAPLRGEGPLTDDILASTDPLAIDLQEAGISSGSGRRKTTGMESVISEGEEEEKKLLVYS